MGPDEDAAITYDPDGHGPSAIDAVLAEAERELSHRAGVNGLGLGQTADGRDAVVVYVADSETLSRLPRSIRGVPVMGEVTGEIRAL